VLDRRPLPFSDAEARASTRLILRHGTTVNDAFSVLAQNYLRYLCRGEEEIAAAKRKLEVAKPARSKCARSRRFAEFRVY
jgi:hypothetical protein